MDEITIGEKTYISSKRASEITGYAKDYIGQLAREGYVDAKKVGRSWYVYEPSIREHRFGDEEDELQAQGESLENSLESALENEREAVAETESALRNVKERLDTWKQPVYTPEEPQTIPQTASKPEKPESAPYPAYEELLPPAEETLTDMQAAWKEWFERKQEAAEAPEEDMEEESEEDEVAVPLHRMDEPEEDEEEYAADTEDDEEGEPIAIHALEKPAAAVSAPAEARSTAPARYDWEHAHPQAPEARIVEERIIRRAPASWTAPAKPQRTQGTSRAAARASRRSNAPVVALLVGISVVVLAVTYIGSGFADPYLKTLGFENPVLDYLVGTRTVNK